MKLSARFTCALAALPADVGNRLDDDDQIDWNALADPSCALGIEEAVRTSVRLPRAVEALAQRLVADVGIAPVEVAEGSQGRGRAATWMHAVAVEPDGERYRLRIKRSGELLPGVRPAVLAGYTVLAMELATAVHQARDAWIRAGAQAQAIPDDERDALTACAADLHHRLQALSETAPRPPSALVLAQVMEDGWNAQTVEAREALAMSEFACPRDACAPQAHYLATETGFRLHAFDIAEARWLQALGVHAGSDTRPRGDDGRADADPAGPAPVESPFSPETADRPEPQQWPGGMEGLGPEDHATADSGDSAADPDDSMADPDDGEARPGDGVAGPDNNMAEIGDADPLDGPSEATEVPAWQAGLTLDDPSLDEVLKSELGRPDAPSEHAVGESLGPEASLAREPHAGADAVPAPRPPSEIADSPADAGAGLLFGTPMGMRSPQAEIDLLVQAARRVPAAVTQRLADACGGGTAELLGRLQDPDCITELQDTLGTEPPGDAVPGWLEELAARLLPDTGAETQDGLRAGPVQLDLPHGPEGLKVNDPATSASGVFRAIDVVQQVRLSLSFANDTWSALTLLGDAGKEAEWTLHDVAVKQARLTNAERTRLEAAVRIEQELQRIRRTRADGSPVPPSALEEASLTASALKSLQPSERADAGWPAEAGLPNPRDPSDIARVTAAAESLRRDVRVIANRLIAAWVTGAVPAREARDG